MCEEHLFNYQFLTRAHPILTSIRAQHAYSGDSRQSSCWGLDRTCHRICSHASVQPPQPWCCSLLSPKVQKKEKVRRLFSNVGCHLSQAASKPFSLSSNLKKKKEQKRVLITAAKFSSWPWLFDLTNLLFGQNVNCCLVIFIFISLPLTELVLVNLLFSYNEIILRAHTNYTWWRRFDDSTRVISNSADTVQLEVRRIFALSLSKCFLFRKYVYGFAR